MKYAPKKVFILENGTYTEVTYGELCDRTKTGDPSYTDKLFLPLHGMLMEVTKGDYVDFYKAENHQKYLNRQSAANGDISYDMLTTDEFNGEDILIDDAEDVATQVERRIMTDGLNRAIINLSEDEQLLIHRYYYADISETTLATLYGISQQAISKRIRKICVKLKKLLES